MKEIVMLAETQGTADYVSHQLNEIFSPYASLSVLIADPDLPPLSLSASLVVIISKVLEDQMQRYIKPGTRVLIADRMMDPCEAARLYDIPAGSDVLVVNTSPRVTEESIQQLIACGIDGLQYHAYYPGIVSYPTDCSYVVTFGEAHLIPPGSYISVLDLHSRPVGISTCVRIADELGIYDQLRKTLSSLYMNPLIRTTRDLALTGSQNKQMSENLQQIIDLFQDGVVVLDKDEKIIFFNDIARRILKIRGGVSHSLNLLRKEHPLTDHFFQELQGSNYYFEPIPSRFYREKSTILMIRDVEKIEHIENSYRRTLVEKGLVARFTFGHIIHCSPLMETIIKMAEQFARGDSTIFIHGPSGCGKEMLAQAIHNASARSTQPFVAVNFASIPASLSESELFGYEEGAFTGAKRGGKRGLFQLANQGTIFLDEIGDAPLELQKKLLRVIQERKVLPVGGTKFIPVDVRIIAASNQDMDELILSRQFREDLYYRLNVLPLHVPPLRQRREDIIPLFLHFLHTDFGIQPIELNQDIRETLENHPWNGNVRELRNAAEYLSNFISWDPDWQQRIHFILHSQGSKNRTGSFTNSLPSPNYTATVTSYKSSAANTHSVNIHPSEGATLEEQILSDLEAHGDLRYFYSILEVLDRPPYRWSRRAIAEELSRPSSVKRLSHSSDLQALPETAGAAGALPAVPAPAPSDSQIKRDLLLLKNLGIVNAVTGKGTFLKDTGRAVLRLLECQLTTLK